MGGIIAVFGPGNSRIGHVTRLRERRTEFNNSGVFYPAKSSLFIVFVVDRKIGTHHPGLCDAATCIILELDTGLIGIDNCLQIPGSRLANHSKFSTGWIAIAYDSAVARIRRTTHSKTVDTPIHQLHVEAVTVPLQSRVLKGCGR